MGQMMRQSWRTPGVIITCGCIIALIGFGVRSSFGLFTEPLSAAQGWNRDVFALAIALQNLVWGLGQPFAGALADRFGAARTLAAGGVAYAAGTALTSVASTPVALYASTGILLGIGLAGASFAVVFAAFARLVPEERRSWSLGLATATGSLGQFLFAPMGQAFIAAYGWQTALVLLAVSVMAIPLLATGLAGAGEPRDDAIAAANRAPLPPVAVQVQYAFGHGSYVLLFIGFFVCGFHVAFITTHLPPYLTDLGAGAALAGWAIALIGLFNVIGSYTAGVLGARWRKRTLLSGIYLARAVAFTLFIVLPKTPVVVLSFAVAMGLLWLSTVPLTSGLVAVMFGPRSLGLLFGMVFLSHQVGAFFGVWLGGLIYEQTGSYDPIWWLSAALGLVAAALHWPIAERPAPRLAGATA